MLQSFFNGLSGLFSFSKGLDNVSNNIANMNTPGFRGTDTFMRSVNGNAGDGFGTAVEGTSTRLTSGEVRQTGNNTDVAITGRGLFILRDGAGDLFYTRAGQFQFNEENILVDAVSQMQVMSINEAENLEPIDITNNRILPAAPTSQIDLAGNLSATGTSHTISNISIFDSRGESHNISLEFTNNSPTTPDSWTVQVLDDAGNSLGSGEIRFSVDGSPLENFNSFDQTFTFSGVDQAVSFNFGDPGTFGSSTQFSGGSSTLGADVVDGNGVLGLSKLEFDSEGIAQFTYSNGNIEEGQQIALALFSDETSLIYTAGSLLQANQGMTAQIGRPDTIGLGRIQGGSIELSNVDLTQEFADILIIQRGYQASSRVMSVSNEMIEQLYNNTRGG